MAKEGKSSKQGRNKNSASMVAYKAQGRLERNKKRRVAKEQARQDKFKVLRAVGSKRK